MAEETWEAPAQEQGQQQAPAQQQNQPAPSSFKLPSGLGQMLSSKDRAEFEKVKAKIETAKPETPAPAEQAEPPKKNEGSAPAAKADDKNTPPPPTEAPKEQTKNTESEEKSLFGLGKKQKEGTLIGSEKDLLEVINKSFGMSDIKELKDTGKFIETAKDWRAQAQKLPEVEKNYQETIDALAKLPEPIVESMKAYWNGEDYAKPFADRPNFDFDKPVEKQNKVELIKHYFPKQYSKLTEDEIDELKEGKTPESVEPLEVAATEKFKTQQEARNNQRAAILQKTKQTQEAWKKSVSSSVDYLKQSFPEMDTTVASEAATILSGGTQEILKVFLNNDGTLKKEAAEYLMMAKHGKSEMKRLEKIAANRAETKANEDILTRGSDNPKPKKSGNGSDGAPKISKEMEELIKRATQTGSGSKKVF